MNRSCNFIIPGLMLLVCGLATACFGSVQIVPASQAPQPAAGSGWYCVDYAIASRDDSRTTSSCHRTEKACKEEADATRQQQPGTQVGFCAPSPEAWCTAIFTNESDARFECSKSQADCGPVGGMAGVPGTKQSECAVYK